MNNNIQNKMNKNVHTLMKFEELEFLDKVMRFLGYSGLDDYEYSITVGDLRKRKDVLVDFNKEFGDKLDEKIGHDEIETVDRLMQLIKKLLKEQRVPFTMKHKNSGNYLQLSRPDTRLEMYLKEKDQSKSMKAFEPIHENLEKFMKSMVYREVLPLKEKNAIYFMLKQNYQCVTETNKSTIHELPEIIDPYLKIKLPNIADMAHNIKVKVYIDNVLSPVQPDSVLCKIDDKKVFTLSLNDFEHGIPLLNHPQLWLKYKDFEEPEFFQTIQIVATYDLTYFNTDCRREYYHHASAKEK